MDLVIPTIPPCPNSPGIEGHGEGVEHKGRTYYYRVGKYIPKDKVVSVRWEGNYCGRTQGEVEHLILAWNGETFTVLGEQSKYYLKNELVKYKGKTPKEAIKLFEAEQARIAVEIAARPKCETCGEDSICLFEGQRPNECCTCYKTRTRSV